MKILKLIIMWLIWLYGLGFIASIAGEHKTIAPIAIYTFGSLTIFLIISLIKNARFMIKISNEYMDKPLKQDDQPEEMMKFYYKYIIPFCIKRKRFDLAKLFYTKMVEFDPQSEYVKKLYEKYPLLEMK